MGSYMEDYISKSDLIIIGSQSDNLPDGIHIPDKTGIIRVKYPYKNLNSVVMSYFGGKNEEN